MEQEEEKNANHRYRCIGGGSKPSDGAMDKSHGTEQFGKVAK